MINYYNYLLVRIVKWCEHGDYLLASRFVEVAEFIEGILFSRLQIKVEPKGFLH
jgi:hypothetical protein